VAGPGDAIILPIGRTVDVRNDATQPASAIVISAVGFKATAGGQSFHPRWSL
jgi:hypothetical protein